MRFLALSALIACTNPPADLGKGIGSQTETCTADADCSAPVACADARCDAGRCSYLTLDADKDGHRAAAACTSEGITVQTGDDCDDSNPARYPGNYDGPAGGDSPARCDGVDNDCNQLPDDGSASGARCTCIEGAACAASGWDIANGNIGNCTVGHTECNTDGTSTCVSARGPTVPNCATDGDFNCNGAPDNTELVACDGATPGECPGMTCPGSNVCTSPSKVQAFTDNDEDQYCAEAVAACPGSFSNKLRPESECKKLGDARVADCDDNSQVYGSPMATRTDTDGDQYCVGAAVNECPNHITSGRRLAATCMATDDCDDVGNTAGRVWHTLRADADGDHFCAGASYTWCGTEAAPAGALDAANCNAQDDCCVQDPGSATCVPDVDASQKWVLARRDDDADGFCAGAEVSHCGYGKFSCSTVTGGCGYDGAIFVPPSSCQTQRGAVIDELAWGCDDVYGETGGTPYCAKTQPSHPIGEGTYSCYGEYSDPHRYCYRGAAVTCGTDVPLDGCP